MLQIQLKWVDSKGEVFQQEGTISNISNLSSLSSYHIQLGGRSTKHTVSNYPRWCEDPLGLVARAIASGKSNNPSPMNVDDINHVECSVGIVPGGWGAYRELSKCEWHRQNTTTGLLSHKAPYRDQPLTKEYALNHDSKDAWQIVKGMIVYALWNRNVKMPKALPLVVPEVQHGDLRVVRLEDIPEHARGPFANRMSHSGRPLIPELGDVYYVWDWYRFVGR